jgi:predicted transcriptional regulator
MNAPTVSGRPPGEREASVGARSLHGPRPDHEDEHARSESAHSHVAEDPSALERRGPGRHMESLGLRDRMLPNLEEIPRLRRALGLSQPRLASMAGISQSAIAKIERGKTNPSYTVVKRLFECLDAERRQRERVATVADVRSRRVVSVGPSTLLENAVAEMRHHKFSQLPVIDGRSTVGSLGERTITNLILSGKGPSDFSRMRVQDVMEAPFPTIDEQAPVYLAAELLQHYSAVLATVRGEVQGIVTKSDILKLV